MTAWRQQRPRVDMADRYLFGRRLAYKSLTIEGLHNSEAVEFVTYFSANFRMKSHPLCQWLMRRTAMKNLPHRTGRFGSPLEQLVTDSMILTETYVDSAIRGHRVSFGDSLEPARGIVNGMFIGLIFWVLMLLLFIAF